LLAGHGLAAPGPNQNRNQGRLYYIDGHKFFVNAIATSQVRVPAKILTSSASQSAGNPAGSEQHQDAGFSCIRTWSEMTETSSNWCRHRLKIVFGID